LSYAERKVNVRSKSSLLEIAETHPIFAVWSKDSESRTQSWKLAFKDCWGASYL